MSIPKLEADELNDLLDEVSVTLEEERSRPPHELGRVGEL
jgi:hypothetical protein